MDKREILNVVYDAIIEVAPYTADFLTKKSESGNHNFFLVDLGVNSINYAEIAQIVMDKLHLVCPLDVFTCTNRIDDVAEIFYDLTLVEA
jgi:acyl carrier protein